jgi:phage terminase large subunit
MQHVRFSELATPHPRQVEFLSATDGHRYTLYGGARGGGKSRILRWALLRFALQLTRRGFRNCILGLFCISFPELRLRQIAPIKREFPSWLGYWNETEKAFILYPEYGGHQIRCCNIDDPEKYKSAEFAAIAVDELTLLPSKDVFDTLRGSLRWPGLDRALFMAGTNPDGPGHSWVKRLWITGDFSHPDDARLPANEFAFVRSLPTDNPHLSEEYIENELGSQPPSVRKAWLEGSWDLFEGQRFNLNPAVHVVDPFELRKDAKFYASIDYGFDNPFACGIYMVVPGLSRPDVFKVRELNEKGLKAREQAKRVLETLDQLGITLASAAYLDTACWAEEDDGLSIAQKFMQEGLMVQQVLKDRPTGWVAVEDLLTYETDGSEITKQPRLKIFKTCPLTIQQITDAVWDPKKPGDIMHPEGFRDDSLDETRYFALTHFQKPKESQQSSWQEDQKARWKAMQRSRRR